MRQVSLVAAHSQEFPPDTCPQTSPLGHVPPQAGAGEESQVKLHTRQQTPKAPMHTSPEAQLLSEVQVPEQLRRSG